MPLGSGLGSSAASSVAAIYAINELMGRPKTLEELLPYAMEGERVACGAAHADNVAPGLYGGFVLVRSYDPLDVIKLKTPDALFATVVHPHIEVKTKDAREILRKQIYFKDSVRQSGNVAGLITGLLTEDFDLISRSMHDHIVDRNLRQIGGNIDPRITAICGFEQVRLIIRAANLNWLL